MKMAVVSKVFSMFFSILFIVQQVAWSAPGPFSYAVSTPVQADVMVEKLLGYRPSIYMTGIEITKDGRLRFAWEKVRGKKGLPISDKEKEMNLRYFLSALALPDDNFWVNLNATVEEEEILGAGLKFLDMGKVFLAADVELKRDAKRLLEQTGVLEELFEQSAQYFGTDRDGAFMPRFWIVPERIEIEENDRMMYVKSCRFTVKVEVRQNGKANESGNRFKKYAERQIRQEVLPQLVRMVNTDPKYMPLRQAVHAIVAARWYEKHGPKLNGRFSRLMDSGTIGGLRAAPWSKRAFLEEYLRLYYLDEMDTMSDSWYVVGGGIVTTGTVVDGANRSAKVGSDKSLSTIASDGKDIAVDELEKKKQGEIDYRPGIRSDKGITTITFLGVILLLSGGIVFSDVLLGKLGFVIGAMFGARAVKLRFADVVLTLYSKFRQESLKRALNEELDRFGLDDKQKKKVMSYVKLRLNEVKGLTNPRDVNREIAMIIQESIEKNLLTGNEIGARQLTANIMVRLFLPTSEEIGEGVIKINNELRDLGFKPSEIAIAILRSAMDPKASKEENMRRLDAVLDSNEFRCIFTGDAINTAREWLKGRMGQKKSQNPQTIRIDNPFSKTGTAKVEGIETLSYGSWRIITENKVLIGGELERDNERSKLLARDKILAPVRDAYQGLAQALYEDIFGEDAVESRKAKVLLFDRGGENLFGFTIKKEGQRIVGIEWLLAQLAKPFGYDSSHTRALASLVMHELVEAELEESRLEVTEDGNGIIINIDGKEELTNMLNDPIRNLRDPAAISLYKMAIGKLKEGGKDAQEKARHYLSVAIVGEMMPDANRELTAYIYAAIGKRLGEFLEKTLLVEGIDEGVFGIFAKEYKEVIEFIKDAEKRNEGFTIESMEFMNKFYSAISEGTTDAILQFVRENIADLSRDTDNVKRFKVDVDKITGYYKNGDIDEKLATFLVIDAIYRHNIMPDSPDKEANRDALAKSISLLLAQIALHVNAYLRVNAYIPGMHVSYNNVKHLMSIRAELVRTQSNLQEDIHPEKTGGIDLSLMRLVPVSLERI